MTKDALPLHRQLRLELSQPASTDRADFVVSGCNSEAVRLLDAWPDWPGGVLVLVGPSGAGKSHLALDWARRTDAVIFTAATEIAAAAGRNVLADAADAWMTDEALFHLINKAAQGDGSLLLTSRAAPLDWACRLPDLRSRLNALTVALIDEPDDVVMEAALRRFFRARNIRPGEDVYPYLLRRIERSIPQAREIVRRLDEAADAQQRPISRVLAREILEDDDATLDLFE